MIKYQKYSLRYWIITFGFSLGYKHWKADRQQAKFLINEDKKKELFEAQYDHYPWM